LATDGLFAVVRHPTYASLGLAMGALALASGGVGRLLFTLGLFVLFAGKARWEERMLTERFPVYPAYAARVPRFIPRPRRSSRP
jgi:protein-S-isoprenylcysteine O-methyltransferase Ste14